MSSSAHVHNKKKDILVLGEGPAQGLDGTAITVEAKYPIYFTELGKRCVSSLHYNGSDSSLFVNAVKMYQLKAKDSETKSCPLCLGTISKNVKINNLNKTGLKRGITVFSAEYNAVDASDILDI